MTDAGDGQEKVTLGGVLDAVIAGLTKEQFSELSRRTGHAEVPPKQKAAEALSALVQRGNLAYGGATTGEVIAKLHRHGWRQR